MKKHTFIAILILVPNIVFAGEWYAIGDVKINEKTIENKLWRYLYKNSPVKFKPRQMYSYQYMKENSNSIYINAFCNIWNRKKLNKELQIVEDGGSCYFGINYNLKTGQFYKLNINGEA